MLPPKSTKACERAGGSVHVVTEAAPRVRSKSSPEPHAEAVRAVIARTASALNPLDTSTIIHTADLGENVGGMFSPDQPSLHSIQALMLVSPSQSSVRDENWPSGECDPAVYLLTAPNRPVLRWR